MKLSQRLSIETIHREKLEWVDVEKFEGGSVWGGVAERRDWDFRV